MLEGLDYSRYFDLSQWFANWETNEVKPRAGTIEEWLLSAPELM